MCYAVTFNLSPGWQELSGCIWVIIHVLSPNFSARLAIAAMLDFDSLEALKCYNGYLFINRIEFKAQLIFYRPIFILVCILSKVNTH